MNLMCRFPGCGKETRRGHSLCPGHEKQLERRGPDGLAPLGDQVWKGCSIAGCERRHYAKGMCGLHFNRASKGLPLDPWTARDEACYQAALREVAGIFERWVSAAVEAGTDRAKAEHEFRAEFQLLAELLPAPVLEGIGR